jgi:hypothetical protein
MALTQWFERIAGAVDGAAAKLVKARKILYFDPADFDVDDVSDVTVQGTTSNPGIGTGYTRVRRQGGSTGIKVRLPLVLGATSTQIASNADSIVGTRYLVIGDYLSGATTVTLYGLVGRSAGGASRVHLQLYDETGAASVVTDSTIDAVGEIVLDCSSIIGVTKKLYSVRLWSVDAGTAAISVAELRIS